MPRRNRNVNRRCPVCCQKVPLSQTGALKPHRCLRDREREQPGGDRNAKH